jgi:hypothetical protein
MKPGRSTLSCFRAAVLATLAVALIACATRRPPAVVGPAPPPAAAGPSPAQTPPPPPAPPVAATPAEEEPTVASATEEITVSVWSEPKRLPLGGGQAQIIIRAQKAGNRPVPGLEVQLKTSQGSLYSQGRVLVTDARGMTRDRLITTRTANVKVNAGGVRHEIVVPVGEAPAGD